MVHKLVVDKMKLESERVVSVLATTASNATRDLDEVHFLSLYIHTYIQTPCVLICFYLSYSTHTYIHTYYIVSLIPRNTYISAYIHTYILHTY